MSNEITNSLNAKLFYMVREADESGVSGTGRVLDGILWANGWLNIMWRTDLDPMKRGLSSITFFDSFQAFESIHITSHPTNNTKIVWVDDEVHNLNDELEDTKEELKTCKSKLKDIRKDYRELKEMIKEDEDPVEDSE